MAAHVGEEYGRSLASRMTPSEGQRTVRAAMHVVAETLTAHGFAAHAEDRGETTAVIAEQCPFGDASSTNPRAVRGGPRHGQRVARRTLRHRVAPGTAGHPLLAGAGRRRPAPPPPESPVARTYLDHASTTPPRPEAVAAADAVGHPADRRSGRGSTRKAVPTVTLSRRHVAKWPPWCMWPRAK